MNMVSHGDKVVYTGIVDVDEVGNLRAYKIRRELIPGIIYTINNNYYDYYYTLCEPDEYGNNNWLYPSSCFYILNNHFEHTYGLR